MGAPEPFIGLDWVGMTYEARSGPVEALRDISLGVGRGEFVALVGPSGCGKSTLLRIVAGLRAPTGGDVTVGGRPVTRPLAEVGMVFQAPVLLKWRTVLDNVLLPIEILHRDRRAHIERAQHLLNLAGIAEFASRYPRELSGGMQQRVAICRALIHDPRLLLMDEPFGALDALTRDQMNLDLQRIWYDNKKTVLFVTHSIPEAVFLGDRVLVMAPSPTKIRESIEIDLPRPRSLEVRESPQFAAHIHRITQLFYQMGILRS